jgi:HK97 family phage prohead protease
MTAAQLHYREFAPDDLQVRRADDGFHYAEGLAVPYLAPTDIVEIRDGEPIAYREQFARGAFDRAVRAPNRVTLVYGHSDSFPDRLGYMTELTDTPAGLRMRARLDPSRAEQAVDALTNSHSALSIGFASIVPRAGTEESGTLVTRRAAHLAHIAAVTAGAYAGAQLTLVRADETPPEPTPAELAAADQERQRRELAEWAASLAESNPWADLRR